MKRTLMLKQQIIPSPDEAFERMKKTYIAQIQRADSNPQKVRNHQFLDSRASISRLSWCCI